MSVTEISHNLPSLDDFSTLSWDKFLDFLSMNQLDQLPIFFPPLHQNKDFFFPTEMLVTSATLRRAFLLSLLSLEVKRILYFLPVSFLLKFITDNLWPKEGCKLL